MREEDAARNGEAQALGPQSAATGLAQLVESAPVAIVAVDAAGRMRLLNAAAENTFGYPREDLLGQPVERLMPERFRGRHPAHRAEYGKAPKMRSMGPGLDLWGRRADGTEFPIEVGLSQVELGDESLTVSTILDISATRALEAGLERRVAERTRELEQRQQVSDGLREMLRLVNADRGTDEILEHILCQAERHLDADSVAIYCREPGAEELRIKAERRAEATASSPLPPLHDEAALTRAVAAGDPVAIGDLEDASHGDGHEQARYAALRRVGYRALLAVPLPLNELDLPCGMELYFASPQRFDDNRIALAAAFCRQSALVIENARLRAKAAEAAIAEERNRIARDLHDSVTQTLFASAMIAEATGQIWEIDPEAGRERLEEMEQLTRGALAEMRALLFELRPQTLTAVPVAELLNQLADAVSARARIPVRVQIGYVGEPEPDIKEAVYRITQEALNNVARHAQASGASVELSGAVDQGLRLSIEDDGNGFDPREVPPAHIGLTIMRERAEAIGANIEVSSQLGAGTTVLASIEAQPVRVGDAGTAV